jgi:hypothetical protein
LDRKREERQEAFHGGVHAGRGTREEKKSDKDHRERPVKGGRSFPVAFLARGVYILKRRGSVQ